MYDLTSTLITISAASASFVAILGGFIASKLITISGERSSTKERIEEVEKELQFLKEQNTTLLTEILDEDALSFVINHIESLIEEDDLDSIYDSSAPQSITLDDLKPYWEKAVNIFRRFLTAARSRTSLNDDNVPISLAQELKEDNFGYTICKEIADVCNRNASPHIIRASKMPRLTPKWYNDNLDTINSNEQKIKSLEFSKQQLTEREKSLREPEGIKIGFLIFALFSVLCIVAPLAFSPFSTDSYCLFVWLKIAFTVCW